MEIKKICGTFPHNEQFNRTIIGLHFTTNNSVVIETTHGLTYFPRLTMQVKTASSETTTKLQPTHTDDALIMPPRTTKTITTVVDLSSERSTTSNVTTPLDKFTETESLLISRSMPIIFDKQVANRLTNTTELPHLIKKTHRLQSSPWSLRNNPSKTNH